MAQPTGPQSPTLGVMLAIEGIRDAIHFVSDRPTETVDIDKLIDALIALYRSVGLEHEEAKMLYGESMNRLSQKLLMVEKERLNG